MFTIMFKSTKTGNGASNLDELRAALIAFDGCALKNTASQTQLEVENTLEEINDAFKNRCLLLNHLGFNITKFKSNFSVFSKKGKLHGVLSIRQTRKSGA